MNEKEIKKHIDERIFFWEETLKDLEENMTDGLWAMDKNKLMVNCYIETYKNIKKAIL